MAQKNNELPTKEQLKFLLQRYSSIQLVPLDNGQAPMTISSDTANFNKPIFFNTDLGKTGNKIQSAINHQATFPPTEEGQTESRILLEGDGSLISKAIHNHAKLSATAKATPSGGTTETSQAYEIKLIRGDALTSDVPDNSSEQSSELKQPGQESSPDNSNN